MSAQTQAISVTEPTLQKMRTEGKLFSCLIACDAVFTIILENTGVTVSSCRIH